MHILLILIILLNMMQHYCVFSLLDQFWDILNSTRRKQRYIWLRIASWIGEFHQWRFIVADAKYFLQLHVILQQFTSNCLNNRFASNYDTILLQFCKVRFEFPIEMLSQVTNSHAFLFSLLSVFPSRATFYLTFKRTSIFHF